VTGGWKLAAIGDEIAAEPAAALAVMHEAGVQALELRSAWGKNVLALSDDELRIVQQEAAARGMPIPVIASPIGKTPITDPVDHELARLDRALAIAEQLGAWGIRIFSFYLPDGAVPEQYRAAVLARLQQFVERAARRGIVLLHENEKLIYGDIPERCHDILASINSPWLRAVWDPANFVQCGVRPHTEGFALLAPYIAHVHIKDAQLATGQVTPAGEGDGEVAETLAALAARGYDGYLSFEPHLALAGERGGFSGPEAFARAVAALRRLLDHLPAPHASS
jgi:sugar phosphate isomerase/epimerase